MPSGRGREISYPAFQATRGWSNKETGNSLYILSLSLWIAMCTEMAWVSPTTLNTNTGLNLRLHPYRQLNDIGYKTTEGGLTLVSGYEVKIGAS